ncbi:MAG: hypothetical protein FWG39_03895 [Alphaproteobacteria bacterium]|nr:hypothetical protein [Alphaproteobacteria bacterium]
MPMLSGVTFFTTDDIWSEILSDLGATPAPRNIADLVFNPKDFALPAPALGLKAEIMAKIDASRDAAVRRVAGPDACLSPLLAKIITLLYRAGESGIAAADLRAALGYAPNATSHALDTAICSLRKQFGQGFIRTENEKYIIRQ